MESRVKVPLVYPQASSSRIVVDPMVTMLRVMVTLDSGPQHHQYNTQTLDHLHPDNSA
uniref:Uncharacterized protein n=1 Tax=Anguilla anguilla TaxID=7936 RepID=A0A0E9VR90_ANGAN